MRITKSISFGVFLTMLGIVVMGCGLNQLPIDPVNEITNTRPENSMNALGVSWFIGENYPDGWNFTSNQAFTKSWTIRNNGTTTWRGYRLVFVSGARLGAPSPLIVPDTAPGATVTLDRAMQTPDLNSSIVPAGCVKKSGASLYRLECTGNWQLQNSAGQSIYLVWINIGVDDAWGRAIGSFSGVTVFSNGSYTGSGSPTNRGSFGYLYQCVEFVKRYYNSPNWTGNAYQFWDNGPSWGLKRYSNGQTNMPPQPGDIFVFNSTIGGGFGHVSIVSSVTLPSNNQTGRVTTIAQNSSSTNPFTTYTLSKDSNGFYKVNSTSLNGWMRR